MSCDKPSFPLINPPSYGTPRPRYFRPLVRINGMANDLPFGNVIDPCWLPMEAIAEATNQTMALTGNVLTLDGGGGSVTLPASTASTALYGEVVNDPSPSVYIPFSVPFVNKPFVTLTPIDGGTYSDFCAFDVTPTGFYLHRGYAFSAGGVYDIAWKAEETPTTTTPTSGNV